MINGINKCLNGRASDGEGLLQEKRLWVVDRKQYGLVREIGSGVDARYM